MLIQSEERRSALYNTLVWMGLIATEDHRIRTTRENTTLYEDYDLTYEDIERVGYFYPHFRMNRPVDKEALEIWIDDEYINPDRLTWIDTAVHSYAVLDKEYDEDQVVKIFMVPHVLFRHRAVAEDDLDHVYVTLLDLEYYEDYPNIENQIYYISEDRIQLPECEKLDSKTMKVTAHYKKDIDFIVCGDIVNICPMTANGSSWIDHPYSKQCNHIMIVDHDSKYPIDTKFYPCVRVDKDCVIRMFNTVSHGITYPETTRLALYPEFVEDVRDPYGSDIEYLRNLPTLDIEIDGTETDEEMLEKFAVLCQYWYRVWEKFDYNYNEQSDFIVCDNEYLSSISFFVDYVYLKDIKKECIISTVPCEDERDLLFYNGELFTDYTIKNIRRTSEGQFVEDDVNGKPTYLIDISYNCDKFSVIKFNTDQDSSIMNIGDYIDVDVVAQMHYKLNRFYRNLLIIKQTYLDDTEYVRVSNTEPDVKDGHLWFELLTNAIPEMFKNDIIHTIDLYGLDPNNIPDIVKNGAYMIELDPEDGPASYRELMMTYFTLKKSQKQYLALQYDNPVDDPRTQSFDRINVGKTEDHEELNVLLIEDDTVSSTETTYEAGRPDTPGTENYTAGDLYAQNLLPPDPPPGEGNTNITKIETGPNIPENDEHTLWIDTDLSDDELPRKDSLDSVTENLYIVNDPDTLDATKGDFAIDSNEDTLLPEQEGEMDIEIDSLFENLDDMREAQEEADKDAEDLFMQLGAAIANNITVDSVTDPVLGMIALDDIGFTKEDGTSVTMEDVSVMSIETKEQIVQKYFMDDDEPENANINDMWIEYKSRADESVLNTVVYKILLAQQVFQINQPEYGDLALTGDELPITSETIAYGDFPEWVSGNQMLIQPMGTDDDGNVVPDYYQIVEHNVRYIMSITEPDDVVKSDLWLRIPAATMTAIIKNLISSVLVEFGGKTMPKGDFLDTGDEIFATMGFDYDAHDPGTDGLGEQFVENTDQSLHKVEYGTERPDDPTAIWYEYLDDVEGKVVYGDTNSLVVRIDERLMWIQFVNDNIQAYAFDDILMNFRGTLGINYLTIVSDLINSGVIKLSDLNIFYKRLVTAGDDFDPRLERLYTGRSFVISTADIDTEDYAIHYSTNIARLTIDYSAESTTRKEREAAYRHVVDLTNREISYLQRRMLLFVNGKYIPFNQYTEIAAGKLQLRDFDEIIATVDILYSKKDMELIRMKKKTEVYWPEIDYSTSIQNPDQYNEMEYVSVADYTKRGYYDVLMSHYIFSGKLQRILNYLEEHKDEAEEYKLDLIRKFHAISDIDLCGRDAKDSRIVLSMNNSEKAYYEIKE